MTSSLIETLEDARRTAVEAGQESLAKRLSAEIERVGDPSFAMYEALKDVVRTLDSVLYYATDRIQKGKIDEATFPESEGQGRVVTKELPKELRRLQERCRKARLDYADGRGWPR